MPKDFIYESKHVMAFPDIYPVRPVHLLVVPKKHIEDFLVLKEDRLWKEIAEVTQKLIVDNRLDKKGYRLGVNGGGAQMINHAHVHILGPIKRTESM